MSKRKRFSSIRTTYIQNETVPYRLEVKDSRDLRERPLTHENGAMPILIVKTWMLKLKGQL